MYLSNFYENSDLIKIYESYGYKFDYSLDIPTWHYTPTLARIISDLLLISPAEKKIIIDAYKNKPSWTYSNGRVPDNIALSIKTRYLIRWFSSFCMNTCGWCWDRLSMFYTNKNYHSFFKVITTHMENAEYTLLMKDQKY